MSIELPWIPELLGNPYVDQYSTKVEDGAYRIASDVPVTVYQFNPLEYKEETEDGPVFSHTNDASLLLPTHTLTGDYYIMSRPTMLHFQIPREAYCGGAAQLPCPDLWTSSSPGFVAIVGIEPTPTIVDISVKSRTAPSFDGSIPALKPGDTYSTTLQQGEVLQLVSSTPGECRKGSPYDTPAFTQYAYCTVGKNYDLTGTEVNASGRIAVISGHNCAFVPYYRWACDHLEEMMLPLQAWGDQFYIAITKPIREEPNLIRILSASDKNTIRFTPQVHRDVTLDRGEYLEFETGEDFQVLGKQAIMVAQFLVGQDYEGLGSSGAFGMGDPGMSLGIPMQQWRNQYSFLAPTTFEENYVNVIARADQTILLDGKLVGDFHPIEGTSISVARVSIEGGQHTISTNFPFGIMVYGYATYTSYIYPGGLDLREIYRVH